MVGRMAIGAKRPYQSHAQQRSAYKLLATAIILLPMQWFLLPLNLALADMVLMLIVLLTLMQFFGRQRQIVLPLLGPMLLILAASAVGTAAGLQHVASVIAIVQEIYIFTWFVALVNQLRILTPQQQDRLLKIWTIVACIEAATLMMGMLRIGPAMFYTKPMQDVVTAHGLARAVGLHANANAAGVYMAVSFFVALATRWPRWRRWGAALWIYGGMFGTGSNGALLSSLVGTAVLLATYIILTNRNKMKLWGALLTLGIGSSALLLFTFVLMPVGEILGGFSNSNQLLFYTIGRFSNSLASRIHIVDWSWRIYKANPFGVGPNGFSILHGSLHNDYVAFWFERGVLGLMGWLWLIGATLWVSLRSAISSVYQPHHQWRCWAILALGAGFFACAFNAFSHEISHMRQLWMLIVFIFAISSVDQRNFRSRQWA